MKTLGVIPARGGSKSIPLKNVSPLNQKPLIEYSIESALASGVLDRVIVSTDHNEIIKVSKKYEGIEIIRRPPELSTDYAPTESALLHVCDVLEKNDGFVPEVVLTLEPTSPLRSIETIKSCVEVFENTNSDSVMGVVELSHYPGVINKGRYKFLIKDSSRRRQDRRAIYMESSTIYGTKLSFLRKTKSVIGETPYALVVKKNEAVDINDEWDFVIAELILKKNQL